MLSLEILLIHVLCAHDYAHDKCQGIMLDTPIIIKAMPSMRPTAILINIHDHPI